MRYILYLLCVIILVFRDYIYSIYPDAAERLSALYLLAFTFICLDIAVRLRKSSYLFFPIIIAIALFLSLTGLGELNYYIFLTASLYIIISVLLVRKGVNINAKDEKSIASVLYIMAALLVLLGLKAITLITELSFLTKFYDLQIPNFLVAAYAGSILLSKKLPEKYKAENELFVFLVLLNVISIARAFIAGFFTANSVLV